MIIPQPVINSMKRVGIDYELFENDTEKVSVSNRFSGETVETLPLIANLIEWVYRTSNDYERGIHKVNLSDFDRIKYFILKIDSKAYMACID